MAIFKAGRYPDDYQHSLLAVYVVVALFFITFLGIQYKGAFLRAFRGDEFQPSYGNSLSSPARPKTIYETEGLLETVSSQLSQDLSLSEKILLTFEECENTDAFFDRNQSKVGLCYSKLNEISDNVERKSSGEDVAIRQEAKIQVAKFFLYKGIGKALIDVLKLPARTQEAENFAVWFFIKHAQGDELLYTSRYYYPVNGKGDIQKFYFINCLVYGSDTRSYQYLEAGGKTLPAKYLENCPNEFRSLNQRWDSLLQPYLKK